MYFFHFHSHINYSLFAIRYWLLTIGCSLLAIGSFAQTNPLITVKGKIIDADGDWMMQNIMVINKRAGSGVFAEAGGNFNITLSRNDTIMFGATGYRMKTLCFKDSILKHEYVVSVILFKLHVTLKEVEVFPLKSVKEIEKEISKIGVKKTNTYSNYTPMESPITYLYERFSKIEQSKRLVATMESEDRKRDALKDIFRLCIKYDIMSLSDTEFEDFIDYCKLTDNYIKTATMYELITTIKQKYERYSALKHRDVWKQK